MDKKLKVFNFFGFWFVAVLGTFLHFIYEWSGESAAATLVGAVNESTWEHLKLLFWPYFIFYLIEYFPVGKNYDNYIIAKAIGALCGLAAIVVIFYTYVGILGTNYLALDISTFVLGVAVAFWIDYKIMTSEIFTRNEMQLLGGTILIVMGALFILFTYYPPNIGIFVSPV